MAALFMTGCGLQDLPGEDLSTVLFGAWETSSITRQVDQKQLETHLAVLTGHTPFANDRLIKERGGVAGRELTRQYLEETLKSYGYRPERHSYRQGGQNILATLPATVPTDETILFGAHMDSVSNAGANDNGTGSASVLEAARVLRDLPERKTNILFAWFDEEELGLIGSGYLAREFRQKKVKLTYAHTMDMLGWDENQNGAIEVARPDGILWDFYQGVNRRHELNFPLQRTSTGSSDHVSFSKNGFPSVCLSEEWTDGDTTPHYHRKGDVYETVNFPFLAKGTQLAVAAVADMSQKIGTGIRTPFVPHNRFPGRERPFHKPGHGHLQ